ncbi:MAG: glutathione binding-like protein [Pseudomonadota bacterium]
MFDGLVSDIEYLSGKRLTSADIILYAAFDFSYGVDLGPGDFAPSFPRWFQYMNSRPTAKGRLLEGGTAAGFRSV